MKVAKWGNSLAVRLPAEVVAALELKEGDEINFHNDNGRVTVDLKPSRDELIKRLDALRRPMPKDFKFDRDEANAR